jgi:hypothetical protein
LQESLDKTTTKSGQKRRGRYCNREVVKNVQEGCIKPARDVVDTHEKNVLEDVKEEAWMRKHTTP